MRDVEGVFTWCVGEWSFILVVVRGGSIMWEGREELYWLWEEQLAEELFMSMREGSIGVGGVWANCLVQLDGFGDVGWVIA